MISSQECINFADTYYDVLYQVIANRIIGDAYVGDKKAGTTVSAIAQAIYKTSTLVTSGQSTTYYENGIYKQLTEKSADSVTFTIINNKANTNFNIANYLNARNYKAYDVVITGILNQIKNNELYNPVSKVEYHSQTLNNTKYTPTSLTTTTNQTEVYIFSKNNIDLSKYRLQLNLNGVTLDSIVDNNGNTLTYNSDENGLIISYNLNSSVPPTDNIANNIKDSNYIKLILKGQGTYQVYLVEEYITNN